VKIEGKNPKKRGEGRRKRGEKAGKGVKSYIIYICIGGGILNLINYICV
jgi:hypothetical protein